MKYFISCLLTAIIAVGSVFGAIAESPEKDSSVFEPQHIEETSNKGTVAEISIPVSKEWFGEEKYDTIAEIYLPPTYSEETKYNFLLLLSESPNNALVTNIASSWQLNSLSETFDNMIMDGCEPFIVLSIDTPVNLNEMEYRLLAYQIRNDYLPFISANYSVYADAEVGDWMQNRTHSAIMGVGNGAVFAYQAGLYWNVDLFGSYSFQQYGTKLNGSAIAKAINDESMYPVNTFICADINGTNRCNQSEEVYQRIVGRVDYFEDGFNALFVSEDNIETVIEKTLPFLFPLDGIVKQISNHAHIYKDNRCIICNKEPVFYEDNLPRRYHYTCPQQGTIVHFTYETRDWYNDEEGTHPFEKEGLVYLPYEYNEEEQYNVMILLHGHTLNCHAFIDELMGFDYGVKAQFKNDYDWIFSEKLCRPLIVVSLNTPVEAEHNWRDMQFELRYDVLPYIAEHFATYAKDGSNESLIAARDHFGLGGSSNGAGFTHGGGLYSNMAYFGSFALMSGGMHYVGHTQCLNDNKDTYRANCFVRACGSLDPLYEDILYGYKWVEKHVDYLEANKNIYMFTVTQGHNRRVAYTALVNAFQVLFPPMEDEIETISFPLSSRLKSMIEVFFS